MDQMVPGCHEAVVKWQFPAEQSKFLSNFLVRVIKDDDGEEYELTTAAYSRSQTITQLQPSTKYTVTVIAQYKDDICAETSQEHLNCGNY